MSASRKPKEISKHTVRDQRHNKSECGKCSQNCFYYIQEYRGHVHVEGYSHASMLDKTIFDLSQALAEAREASYELRKSQDELPISKIYFRRSVH